MDKIFIIDGKEVKVENFSHKSDILEFSLNGKHFSFSLLHQDSNEMIFHSEDRVKAFVASLSSDGETMIMLQGQEAFVGLQSKKFKKSKGLTGGLVSPMPGKIFRVLKSEGSHVSKGETILILEAMKMEHSIRADLDGVVKKIFFKEGELVKGGVVLAQLE